MKLVSNIALVTLLFNLGLHVEASSSLLRGSRTLAESSKEETKDAKNAERKLQRINYYHSAPAMNQADAVDEEIPMKDLEEYVDYEPYHDDPTLPLEAEEAEDLYNNMLLNEKDEALEQEYYPDSTLEENIEPAYYDYFDGGVDKEYDYSYYGENGEMEEPTLVEDKQYDQYFENAAMEDPLNEVEFASEIDSFNQALYKEENLTNEYLAQNTLVEGTFEEGPYEEEYNSYQDTALEEEIQEEKNYDLMEEAKELMLEAEELIKEADAEGIVDLGEEEFYNPLASEVDGEYDEMYEGSEDGIILP